MQIAFGLALLAAPRSRASADDWVLSASALPSYVRGLEASYGTPSRNGFGSTVLFAEVDNPAELDQRALAAYRYFVGDLWDRWGESAWLGAWRQVYARGGSGDITAELRELSDPSARSSGGMILEVQSDGDLAQAHLAEAFDDPAVAKLLIYNLGDGSSMSGLLIASWRRNGEAVFLVFLMD